MIPAGAKRLLAAFTVLVCAFAVAPVVAIVIESFTDTDFIVFPPPAYSFKWYGEIAKRPEFIESMVVSLTVAVIASVLATVLGTTAALGLARHRFPGRRLLQSVLMAPLGLPALIFGLALLISLAKYGIPRNVVTMAVTHIVITTPFAIRFVTVALAGLDRNIELAAGSLGAGPLRTFRLVTLPLIRPGIVASLVFAFILSFDEVGASLFVSSPEAMTLPVRIFVYIDQNYDPLITSVSALLVFAAAIALAIIEKTIGIGRLFGMR